MRPNVHTKQADAASRQRIMYPFALLSGRCSVRRGGAAFLRLMWCLKMFMPLHFLTRYRIAKDIITQASCESCHNRAGRRDELLPDGKACFSLVHSSGLVDLKSCSASADRRSNDLDKYGETYPYNIRVLEANFTDPKGKVTEFESVKAITEANKHPEGGIRLIIRPNDEVNEETGEVTSPAAPEVAGWGDAGAFKGGTLHIKLCLAEEKEPEPQPVSIKGAKIKGAKTYTVKKAAAVSKTVTKLKSKKVYYARVSAFKKVGKTTYKGAWSAVKKAKIK